MRLFSLLLLAVAPLPLLAIDVNATKILMFFNIYRADYEQNGSKCQIAKACDDYDFEQFILYIDRLNSISELYAQVDDLFNPDLSEIGDWESASEFVYDAKKLLRGLWQDGDAKTRPGHITVIERLVDRTTEVRLSAEPARIEQITEAIAFTSLSRRKAQAKDLISHISGRLNSARLGEVKTQTISFYQSGAFDEIDSLATIKSVQRTKKAAMRKEIVAIARDINGGNVKRALIGRDSENPFVKRALSGGMAVMSLQRGLDSFRQPARRKC
ncbi:hypothetical protein F5X68DRAFT_280039 [Plectosphaerella plurivora]|uniref:Uncharacterized protein n=1 Tax=Plectosphaerella plurivora TaxID=936078 RepID=A0A9P8UQH6_9PEZI|nr:hypothetical protein F5X68DRAFT_280039 [Plectosphaerella plurivora]